MVATIFVRFRSSLLAFITDITDSHSSFTPRYFSVDRLVDLTADPPEAVDAYSNSHSLLLSLLTLQVRLASLFDSD